MKIKTAVYAAILLAAAMIFSGCSGGKDDAAKKAPDGSSAAGDKENPKDVLEKVLEGMRKNRTEGLGAYFSSQFDPKMLNDFLEQKIQSMEIIETRISEPIKDGAGFIVKYRYKYQIKKDGKVNFDSERKSEPFNARLVREDGSWKIARFEPVLDEQIEKKMFLDCVKAVAFARLAMVKYRNDKGQYTPGIADLKRYITDLNLDACASVNISALKDNYFLIAVSKNTPPCAISADKDGINPKEITACPGHRAAMPPRLEPIPSSTPTVTVESK